MSRRRAACLLLETPHSPATVGVAFQAHAEAGIKGAEMRALISSVLLAVASAVAAAPAHADAAEYLQLLDDKYAYLSEQQLLDEGHKVCATLHRGAASPPAVSMVQKDLGVSTPVALDVVAAAFAALSC
jgi:Protein of unknown function (DUF732)